MRIDDWEAVVAIILFIALVLSIPWVGIHDSWIMTGFIATVLVIWGLVWLIRVM